MTAPASPDPAAPDRTAWRRHGATPAAQRALAPQPLLACLQQACAHPAAAPALVGNRTAIGRAALADMILRAAARIRRRVPPRDRLAVLLPQTPHGVAGLLAAAASGRLCIVLNTTDPPERIARLLADSAPAAVLAEDDGPALPPGTARLLLADCLAADPDLPPVPHDPDAPCTVHYTSGSAGRPKGIVLSSYALLTRAAMGIARQDLGPADRLLVPTGIADASSLSAVLAALLAGATKLVVSVPQEGTGGLLRLGAREAMTVLSTTAALLRTMLPLAALPAAVARLRLLRFGGAGVAGADIAQWRAVLPPGCAISHAYGSTEALLVSEWRLPRAVAGLAGMGHVLPGVEYALVDPLGRAVPPGAVGEMVLRGRQLALGEWQSGRVVPGRMPPDPDRPGSRVFRTGDLLRLDADGVLHFAGRADRQVKVNGVRVEPAEIEAVLRAEPGVHDAAVVQAPDGTLHAFVAAPGQPPDALRPCLAARLRAALPPAMRPRAIAVRAALPLLPSAKHDLQALIGAAGKQEER